jgi:FixJ family two-component response regulator
MLLYRLVNERRGVQLDRPRLPNSGVAKSPQDGGLMHKARTVAIIDDDDSVRDSLPELVRELGFEVRVFASAEQFLASEVISAVHCLILDIGLPGMSGPELHRTLRRRYLEIPTIFMTGGIPLQLPSERIGPCLFKPFSGHDLRVALNVAMRDRRAR